MKLQRRTSYALGVLTTLAALFLVGYVYAALYTTVDVGTSSGVDLTARYIGTNRLDLNGTSSAQITHNGTGTRIWSFPAATGTIVLANATQTLTGKTIAGADNTLTVLESQITDSTVLARVASVETISGVWTFTALPQVNGGAFASVANITTHAALTATHGATGAIVGTTNVQTLTGKTIAGADNTLTVLESQITDSTVLARVGSAETISGIWTFTALPQVNGGAFASVANITTHAALTATHGATGAIVGTTNTQTLSGKTLTAPAINGIVTTTGLTLPAFTSGTITPSGDQVIDIGSNTARLANVYSITFLNNYERILLGSGANHIQFKTMNSTSNGTLERLRIGGGVATADITFSNSVIKGLVLGANLATSANNTNTVATTAVRFNDGYFVNFHVLAGVTTGGLFEGKLKPVVGYTPQNGDVVVLVNGTHYAKSYRVGETRPTTAVFINTIKTSEDVDVVKTVTEPVTIDVVKRENITIFDVFGKKHIEVKETTAKEIVTDRVWKNRTIKNEKGETETITVFEDIPRLQIVTKTVKETVTTNTSEAVLYIWEPNALVKVCGIVKAGDRLIAGESGCARTWGDLVAQKNPLTIEALIDFMSKYSSFAVANEDSKDGYVRATVTVR